MKKIFIIIFISLACFGDGAGISHNNKVDLKKLTIKNGKFKKEKKNKKNKKINYIYLPDGMYIYGYYYDEYSVGYYCYGSLCKQL